MLPPELQESLYGKTTRPTRRQNYIIAGGGVAVVVVAFLITFIATGGIASGGGPDRISLHYADATSEVFPTKVTRAALDGWTGSVLCINGRGRFYQRDGTDGPYPLMLMYDPDDNLVGIQVHSVPAQPEPPWEHEPEGLPTTLVENVEFEHWRLGLYLVEPMKSCHFQAGSRHGKPPSGG